MRYNNFYEWCEIMNPSQPAPIPDVWTSLVAWQTFLAAIVGAAFSFGGSFVVQLLDRNRQRAALRAAFGAEISALLAIAEMRQHYSVAEGWIARWKQNEDFLPTMFGTPPESDPVYSSNLDKIGQLGKDAEEVVLFYAKLAAVRTHIKVMGLS